MLHKENYDVLYGIFAINVEFSLMIEIREIHSPDQEIGDLTKFREYFLCENQTDVNATSQAV